MKPGNAADRKAKSEEQRKIQRMHLRWYLNQYFRAARKKEQLEARLHAFRESMGSVGGSGYDPASGSHTNKVGDGAASEVIRIIQVEERIRDQKTEMKETMLNVMKIMDFLPAESTERMILEYRHIDRMSWRQICGATNYSRTTANDYYNRGLDKLLKYKKVLKIIGRILNIPRKALKNLRKRLKFKLEKCRIRLYRPLHPEIRRKGKEKRTERTVNRSRRTRQKSKAGVPEGKKYE